MSDVPAVTDATIVAFRSEHAEVLESAAHPLHGQRQAEITALYEKRYANPVEIVAPPTTAAEYRQKHNDALLDKGHAEHDVRVQELTAITNRDAVGGDEPGNSLMAPADGPEAYDFTRFKSNVPTDESLVPDAVLEQQARTWMHDGGLSKAEGDAMANLYGQSLTWSEGDLSRISQATESGLRQKYGDNAGAAASAALRVAEETPGLLAFLESTNLINHWSVAERLISAAKAKGYFAP